MREYTVLIIGIACLILSLRPERGNCVAKSRGPKFAHFIVEARDANLVVSLPNGKFKATYYKQSGRPQLIPRERTRTDDHELIIEALQAAVAKARELGWIV